MRNKKNIALAVIILSIGLLVARMFTTRHEEGVMEAISCNVDSILVEDSIRAAKEIELWK